MNLAALLEELRAETVPLLPVARGALEKARGSGLREDVVPVRELLHKISGTAAPVGLPHLSRLARFGEELVLLVLNGDAQPTDATLTLIGRLLDAVEAELATSAEAPPPHFSPQAAAAPPSFPPPRAKPKPQGSQADNPQVLFADGDVVSVKLFSKVLADHGFEVKSVAGADAAAAIEEGFGDVLLIDVSKAGVTDAALALLAVAKSKRMPVVALSKLPRDHPSLAALVGAVDDVLTKPVTAETMVAQVRTLAERRRAVRAARARAATALTPVPKSQGGVVLVVDDSRVIRGLVREFLGESNLEVLEAEDGGRALELIDGLTVAPAAAVVDMQMPVLDGLGLTRELRAREAFKALPIVMLSAQDDAATMQAALAAGASAFLVKAKFGAAELRNALRRAGMTIAEPA